MPKNQNNSNQHKVIFVDYKPAELKQTSSKDWRIVFYVKEPGKNRFKRFRKRVPVIGVKTLRKQYAQRMCTSINERLQKGWSPFYDGSAKSDMKTVKSVIDQFLTQTERKLKDNLVRPDTLRAYKSYSKNFNSFLKSKSKEELLCIEYTRPLIIEFLDYIYYEKKRTARTSNNYLFFCRKLAIFMVDHNYLPNNPADKILKRQTGRKKREVLPAYLRDDIFNYLTNASKPYLTLCLCVYFCFIRRTELTKLKVKHVDLINNTIFIPGSISKNKKDGVVTIPKKLKKRIAIHIDGFRKDQFLFSNNDFLPGQEKLNPKKVSDEWAKVRSNLGFANKYQFYSLKDTGITNLLLLGVPAKKVRDQARHHDIRITEAYIARNDSADQALLDLDFSF